MTTPLAGRLSATVAGLYPGYFALVMATGIVSIACRLMSLEALASALLAVNLAAYGVLAALTLARAALYPGRLLADLASHARGPGFFTLVAGTNVLGSQCLLVAGWRGAAGALWGVGLLLWVAVMYAFFTAVIVRREKPTLAEGINGAWLIAAVATQSVAVLGIALATPFGFEAETVAFVALVFFLVGSMLYLAIITLIFYRFTFLALETATLTPPYWINMGAVAIATLAGSSLLLAAERSPLLTTMVPFLAGFTLFFWSTATWWIPLLVLLGAWRHLWRRHPLVYDPQYWGMVFPLGMYSAATFRLAEALPFAPLAGVARAMLPVALLVWVATAFGMAAAGLRALRTGSTPPSIEAAGPSNVD
ncbi:MAG TPA: tellurite resistance/C4-dicarboxylate transporter family protein [Thermoanaerobaculia bacterium]|nr:tellurite resistance/C4-dicarboxylate transporter family protein [Thermoanaerobaculia bacterium]